MRLGGYSHTKGITFFCDVLKVKTLRKSNGEIDYKLEWILPPGWLRRLGKNKYLSVLLVLYYQWRAFDLKLKLLVSASFAITLLEEALELPVLDYIIPDFSWERWQLLFLMPLIILMIPKLIKLFRYHGAEHKVINCYSKHGYVSLHMAKAAPRFNKRCGTNLVVIFIILYGILWAINLDTISMTLAALLLALLLVRRLAEIKNEKWEGYFNMMQFFTVWEPRDEELELAVKGFSALLESHHLYQRELSK